MNKNITISIVDDQPELRGKIIAFLATTPEFKCVSEYASAEEALAHLPQDSPDVILMDINLGDTDGIECVRQLKPKMPKSQVVMLTVFEDTDKIFQALTAGASGYLLKRMPPGKLVEAIREVTEGGSPMSSPIARKVVHLLKKIPSQGGKGVDLSPRERELLDGLAAGLAYKQIGEQMGVSIDTVRTYIRRIYEKLQVHSRTEAVVKYFGHS